MKTTNILRSLSIIVPVCLFGAPASANVILPFFIGIYGFGMFLALIPITLVEGFILMRYGVSSETSYLAVIVANLMSTLFGIPIAFVLEGIYFEKLHKYTKFTKAVYFSFLKIITISCVVFFLLSVLIEAWVAGWFIVSHATNELAIAIFFGNLVTYLVLFVLLVGEFTRVALIQLRKPSEKQLKLARKEQLRSARIRKNFKELDAAKEEAIRLCELRENQLKLARKEQLRLARVLKTPKELGAAKEEGIRRREIRESQLRLARTLKATKIEGRLRAALRADWKNANITARRGIKYLRNKEAEIREWNERFADPTDASIPQSKETNEMVTGTVVPYHTRIKAPATKAVILETKKKVASQIRGRGHCC